MSITRNIGHLRDHLFDQLDMLCDLSKTVDLNRVKAVCEVSEKIIDSARVEVQLAAVMKGAVTLPFIEDQADVTERAYSPASVPAPSDTEQLPAPMSAEERRDAALNSGPAADHPWRQLGSRVVRHRIKS
ncbi:hypothetical protein [Delftia sp. PS-11]|uniref:hypothetical protein n=1 Tax=Delftia sp. PS-11 TaxID=2767222 RepID=UPI0024576BEA|nr:hypothetical protein [Delftia sp. PS-11]KAJ8744578.1 hypothetical protein H9T68_11530 [Delftia sp. PS-11]